MPHSHPDQPDTPTEGSGTLEDEATPNTEDGYSLRDVAADVTATAAGEVVGRGVGKAAGGFLGRIIDSILDAL